MFQRIKNLLELSNYSPKLEQSIDLTTKQKVSKVVLEKNEPEVQAEFFGEGTEEEYKELELEDKGLKGIFGIGK